MQSKDQNYKLIFANITNLSVNEPISKGEVSAFKFVHDRFTINVDTTSFKYLWITQNVRIEAINSQEITLGKVICDIKCFFGIEDMLSFLRIEKTSIHNKEALLELAEITYSTGRGMLIQAFKGTVFEQAFLPFVDAITLSTNFELIISKPSEVFG